MSAALKPQPATCAHDELVTYETTGASGFDDHQLEKGYCTTCRAWVEATVWLSRDDIDYRPLTTAEISILKLNEQARHG